MMEAISGFTEFKHNQRDPVNVSLNGDLKLHTFHERSVTLLLLLNYDVIITVLRGVYSYNHQI